jgi:hypothetical protein
MLEGSTTPLEVARIKQALEELQSDDLVFRLLFSLATNYVGKLDALAASLLVELEPRCPVSCEDVLRLLASGSWQVSDHLVPFYLVTQFGKARLVDAVAVVGSEFEGEARHRVATVGYHAQWPAVYLFDPSVIHRKREPWIQSTPEER